MANTYTLIEAKTLGSAVASVTFSSIPQTYTDLQFLFSCQSVSDDDTLIVQFNGSTSGYTVRQLLGYGSGTGSNSPVSNGMGVVSSKTTTANTFTNASLYIPNYTSANYKSGSADGVSEANATISYAQLYANLWPNTAAITSALVKFDASNLIAGSTLYLYGIKNS